jgi:hypothetical protein
LHQLPSFYPQQQLQQSPSCYHPQMKLVQMAAPKYVYQPQQYEVSNVYIIYIIFIIFCLLAAT